MTPPLLVLGGLGALALLALVSRAGRGRAARPSFAEVSAALDAAVRAHPAVPRWFAYANAEIESGFDPWVVNSRSGAIGLLQILWRAHGAKLSSRGISKDKLLDPAVNASYGVEYMDDLRRAAIAKGYEGDMLWAAVRLRYLGVPFDEFDRADAQKALDNYRPVARKWQARFGSV